MKHQSEHEDSLIEGLARVVAVDKALVWLVAEQPSACGSCVTRGACGTARVKPSVSWQVPRTLGPGQASLALGDTVRIGVDRNALTRASLTAYAVPLATMLVAVVVTRDAGDAVAVAASMAGLLVGVAVAKVWVRRWKDALAPVVLGRAPVTTGSSCGSPSTGLSRGISVPVIHSRSQ